MSAKSEEDLILKLILKGESESDIIANLKVLGLVDDLSKDRVESKIREMKAAQAFLPHRPPRKRIRAFGFLLIIMGTLTAYYFWSGAFNSAGGRDPSGYAFLLIVIGFILVIWPEKGIEKL